LGHGSSAVLLANTINYQNQASTQPQQVPQQPQVQPQTANTGLINTNQLPLPLQHQISQLLSNYSHQQQFNFGAQTGVKHPATGGSSNPVLNSLSASMPHNLNNTHLQSIYEDIDASGSIIGNAFHILRKTILLKMLRKFWI
jgi:hypothetical protein